VGGSEVVDLVGEMAVVTGAERAVARGVDS